MALTAEQIDKAAKPFDLIVRLCGYDKQQIGGEILYPTQGGLSCAVHECFSEVRSVLKHAMDGCVTAYAWRVTPEGDREPFARFERLTSGAVEDCAFTEAGQ